MPVLAVSASGRPDVLDVRTLGRARDLCVRGGSSCGHTRDVPGTPLRLSIGSEPLILSLQIQSVTPSPSFLKLVPEFLSFL